MTDYMRYGNRSEPVRTWTTTDGETLDASWDRTAESNPDVIHLVSRGRKYDINFRDLSTEDQLYIQQARRNVSKFREVSAPPVLTGNYPGERMVKTVDDVVYAFRWCPAGSFLMGGRIWLWVGDKQHQVRISKGFWLLETQVTQAMWKGVMYQNPSWFNGRSWLIGMYDSSNHPVECVSWDDCQEFCRKLSSKIGMKISLPTEAQWEYACRAGTTERYAGKLRKMGWYKRVATVSPLAGALNPHKTQPVAMKDANAWGLYDMHGNVLEWCQDWCGKYPRGSVSDPTGPVSGSKRICRGGCYFMYNIMCASAWRYANPAQRRCKFIGFRIVATDE